MVAKFLDAMFLRELNNRIIIKRYFNLKSIFFISLVKNLKTKYKIF